MFPWTAAFDRRSRRLSLAPAINPFRLSRFPPVTPAVVEAGPADPIVGLAVDTGEVDVGPTLDCPAGWEETVFVGSAPPGAVAALEVPAPVAPLPLVDPPPPLAPGEEDGLVAAFDEL